MSYTHEDKTFTIEITVHSRAHIETGGGYVDEPPWAEIDDIEIDYVEVNGHKVVAIGETMRKILTDAATEEFME